MSEKKRGDMNGLTWDEMAALGGYAVPAEDPQPCPECGTRGLHAATCSKSGPLLADPSNWEPSSGTVIRDN